MPSIPARMIIQHLSLALSRRLTYDEQIHVEEIVLNYYPKAILEHVMRRTRKGMILDFNDFYFPVRNGLVRNARRTGSYKTITGGVHVVYAKMSALLPEFFPEYELKYIVQIAEDLSLEEFNWGLRESLGRNVHSAAYIYKAAISRRSRKDARPTPAIKELDTTDIVCKIHDVESTKEAWQDKLSETRVLIANKGGRRERSK